MGFQTMKRCLTVVFDIYRSAQRFCVRPPEEVRRALVVDDRRHGLLVALEEAPAERRDVHLNTTQCQ